MKSNQIVKVGEQVPGRKTATLNLSPGDMGNLERLAEETGTSKMGIVRDAIHFYGMYSRVVANGGRFYTEDPKTGDKTVYIVPQALPPDYDPLK